MRQFIKRLFASGGDGGRSQRDDVESGTLPRLRRAEVSDSYFDTMSRMQAAISRHDFEGAARLIHENLAYIPEWVKETRQQYGSFDIPSIPSLQQGGKVLALLSDGAGLSRMHEIVKGVPELERWAEKIEEHQYDLRLFQAIQEAVGSHPHCLQTDVKDLVGESNGHRVANLIAYLEKAGRIVRIRQGRAHRLVCAGSADIPAALPTETVKSHRADTTPPKSHELDISSLSYVPLPRAPLRWEEKQTNRERAKVSEAADHFEVRDADWRIEAIEAIPAEARPDPAFRQLHPNDSGLLMIDDLGKAEGLGSIPASAVRYDRAGSLAAKAGLRHGAYRLGIHPLGKGLIAMSKNCVVHAYDDRLALLFETALDKAPEIQALRRRFGIPDDQLKNHIRCVALSPTAERYLFTIVDEAWCVDAHGKGVWGVRLPIKEGWTQVTSPSSITGTSDDVEQALATLGLSRPVTPEDVRRRYRELAKRHHPDLHPGDSQSEGRMKLINLASEVLTGIDVGALPAYMETRYVRDMEQSEVRIGDFKFSITTAMETSEIHAADWIYASSFAANSNSAYLAGYSGRVVLVDHNGHGVRAYDIGSVPRRIVDTGEFLYLLTDTRLYVLHNESLHALVDTFDGGDLVIAQTGFGLLEKKRLRWFRKDGHYLGSVVSRSPIRRVYSVNDRMIVETRQRRSVVQGVPSWWN